MRVEYKILKCTKNNNSTKTTKILAKLSKKTMTKNIHSLLSTTIITLVLIGTNATHAMGQKRGQKRRATQAPSALDALADAGLAPESNEPEAAPALDVLAGAAQQTQDALRARARMPRRNKCDKSYKRKQIKIAAANRYRATHGLPELSPEEIEFLKHLQHGMCPEGCPTVFTRLDSVIKHMETVHSTARPYPCIITCEDDLLCCYAAKQQSDLDKHTAIGKHSSSKEPKGVWLKYRPHVKGGAPVEDAPKKSRKKPKNLDTGKHKRNKKQAQQEALQEVQQEVLQAKQQAIAANISPYQEVQCPHCDRIITYQYLTSHFLDEHRSHYGDQVF